MAEWSIAAVLKTVVPRGTRGSNPCLSAENIESQCFKRINPILQCKVGYFFVLI